MLGLELVVVLGTTVLLCGVLAPRLRISRPVLLLACGVLAGLVPSLSKVRLEPDVVLLLFLPVLLYWESLTASLRSIRRGLRGVVLVSTLLVIATAGAVAVTAYAFGLPWGPAWVLGAAVAPTDATAVAALGRLLPQRSMDMLKAESLVNDGTALVVYGVAVGVTTGGEHLGWGHVSWLFLVAYVGGAAAGAFVAWPALHILRRLNDPMLSNVLALLTPFAAYLLAESVEASGVLAVVVCGLLVARAAPEASNAAARTVGYPFFGMATYLLNATLFVLVGLEIPSAVGDLTSTTLTTTLAIVLVVFLVLVTVRIAFLFLSAYAIRALDRRPEQRLRRVSHRSRIVSGLSGFRGAVSSPSCSPSPPPWTTAPPSPIATRSSSSPPASSSSLSSSRAPSCLRSSAGPACPPTPPPKPNSASPKPRRPRTRWPPSTPSRQISAPARGPRASSATNSDTTWTSSPRNPAAIIRHCATPPTPLPCASPSSPTNAPPSSACATPSRSTTPSCTASSPASTPRRAASPRPSRPSSPASLTRATPFSGGDITLRSGVHATPLKAEGPAGQT